MDDARLNDRFGEDGVDRLGEALEAFNDGDQDIGDAPVLDLVHHPHPELGAFGLLDPDAQNFLGAVRQDAKSDLDRLVPHEAFIPDLYRMASKKTRG